MKKNVLYSTGCPRCKLLKARLDKAGIEYEECADVDTMKNMGITTVPVLQTTDGEMLSYAEAMNKYRKV